VRFQQRGKRDGMGPEDFTVILDAIEERIRGGEQRNMGRESQGSLGINRREYSASLGQRIQVRCLNPAVAIATQVIGAQGVDGD
jgi:hypothetical protein